MNKDVRKSVITTYKEVRHMSIEAIKNVTSNYQPVANVQPVQQATTPKVEPVKSMVDIPLNTGNQDSQPSNEQIKKAVSDLNKKMSNTACQFGINEELNRVTIKIIDKDTKEVIKEFPAEETLEMIEKAWELAGIMVDEKL